MNKPQNLILEKIENLMVPQSTFTSATGIQILPQLVIPITTKINNFLCMTLCFPLTFLEPKDYLPLCASCVGIAWIHIWIMKGNKSGSICDVKYSKPGFGVLVYQLQPSQPVLVIHFWGGIISAQILVA